MLLNNKGQAQVMGIIIGVIGALIGWIIGGRLAQGLLMRLISTILCGVAGYVIVWYQSNR